MDLEGNRILQSGSLFVEMTKQVNVAKSANVWIGAETGLLKSVDIVNKVATNHFDKENYGKDHELRALCWNGPKKSVLYSAHKNNVVREYSIEKGDFVDCLPIPDVDTKNRTVIGLRKVENKFLTCLSSGTINLWSSDSVDNATSISAGDNILCMDYSPSQCQIATGGKENLLKVWDLNSPLQPIFRAKNVPPNWLQHRVPVWVTRILFLPEESKILTTTGTHSIRIYDLKCGARRPVTVTEFSEYPITAAGLVHRQNNRVIVGNTRGEMALFDLRKMKHLVHSYKGFAGSIRDIVCHASLPYIFSCGLDRYLRVHHEDQAKPLHKVYLKSRLNCLLVADLPIEDVVSTGNSEKRKVVEEDDKDGDLWEKMDKTSDNESESDTSDNDNSSNDDQYPLSKKQKVV